MPERDGFNIKVSHTLEFYSIEVTQNGRSGVWRVTHPDGTVKDARFEFTQDAERGALVLSSRRPAARGLRESCFHLVIVLKLGLVARTDRWQRSFL